MIWIFLAVGITLLYISYQLHGLIGIITILVNRHVDLLGEINVQCRLFREEYNAPFITGVNSAPKCSECGSLDAHVGTDAYYILCSKCRAELTGILDLIGNKGIKGAEAGEQLKETLIKLRADENETNNI